MRGIQRLKLKGFTSLPTISITMAEKLNKPLVVEEFGVERDEGDYRIESSTTFRDLFFQEYFGLLHRRAAQGLPIAGSNFWTWGGLGRPSNDDLIWREGDAFVGDPPQEPQGLNSVYVNDSSTIEILREHARTMRSFVNEMPGD